MQRTYMAEVVRGGLAFGEGPRWHDGRLWYSDFWRHAVFSMSADGSSERLELSVPTQPSGLGWLPDGSMLVVSMTDRCVLRWSPGTEPTVHADIAEHCGHWANDLLVGPDGTAYVGNFGFDLDAFIADEGAAALYSSPGPPRTNLVVLAPSGQVRQVVPDLAFPNGMVLTDAGKTLIVAETMASRLTAFDVADDGTLANRWRFASLAGVAPDGICLDAEGQVWVANAVGHEAVRVSSGGEVTAVATSSGNCYACALGGEDGRQLYMITGRTSNAEANQSGLNGHVEVARVDVPSA